MVTGAPSRRTAALPDRAARSGASRSVSIAARGALPATREHAAPKATRSRAASTVVWALVAALATLLGITLLRPEWALRSHQRAELLLGHRLYQRLQHMEEPDRLEVLKSLWADLPPTSD